MGRAGPQNFDKHADRAEKGQPHRSPSKPVRDFMRIPPARESIQDHGQQGKHRDEFYE
jgi:hypothetical protein